MDNNVYALDAATGVLMWNYRNARSSIDPTPVVANGLVYVASAYSPGNLRAKRWYRRASLEAMQCQRVSLRAAAVANGVVYVTSDALYAFNATTGALLYKTAWTPAYVPTVANGVLYVGGPSHNLYAVDAGTGAVLWSYPTGNWVEVAPTVVNGMLYFASLDGNFYAFGLPDEQMSEKFSPPQRPDPAQLTPNWGSAATPGKR